MKTKKVMFRIKDPCDKWWLGRDRYDNSEIHDFLTEANCQFSTYVMSKELTDGYFIDYDIYEWTMTKEEATLFILQHSECDIYFKIVHKKACWKGVSW